MTRDQANEAAYLLTERLGMLCDANEPTPEQRRYVEDEVKRVMDEKMRRIEMRETKYEK